MASTPLRPYLVTLTVKDGPCLSERVKHLLKSHRRLMDNRRQSFKDRAKWCNAQLSAACCAAGGVGSCEVKRGKNSGLWHPHWHAIWLCASPPDSAALKSEWSSITGDSFIVDVRPFRCSGHVTHDDLPVGAVGVPPEGVAISWDQMAGDFCEVFKYALKLGDLSMADNWSAFLDLQRKRLIEPFGVLRGVEIPTDLRDEPLSPDLPFVEVLMAYHAGAYRSTAETHHSHDRRLCSKWPRFSV
jgi:hypothetical protein